MQTKNNHKKTIITAEENKARMKGKLRKQPEALELFVDFEGMEVNARNLSKKYNKFGCDSAIFNAIANAFNLSQDKVYEAFTGERRKKRER